MMSPSDVRPGKFPVVQASTPDLFGQELPELTAFFSPAPESAPLSLADPAPRWLSHASRPSASSDPGEISFITTAPLPDAALPPLGPFGLPPRASQPSVSDLPQGPEPLPASALSALPLPALAWSASAWKAVPPVAFEVQLRLDASGPALWLEPTELRRAVPKAAWEQLAPVLQLPLPSESPRLARAVYLAASLYLSAVEGESPLPITKLLEAQRAGTLERLTRQAAEARADEGYVLGIHDADAAALLSALLERHREAPALLVPPEARALGLLFWSTHPDEEARRQWHLRARSLGRLAPQSRSQALSVFEETLGEALRRGLGALAVPTTSEQLTQAAQWLARELRVPTPRFSLSQEAAALRDRFLSYLDQSDQRELFRLDLQGLEDRPADRLLLVRAWLESVILPEQPLGSVDHAPFLLEAAVALTINSRTPREVVLLPSWITVGGLKGAHPSLVGQSLSLRTDLLLEETVRHQTQTLPLWRACQLARQAWSDALMRVLSRHGVYPWTAASVPLTGFEAGWLLPTLDRLLGAQGALSPSQAFKHALVACITPSALSMQSVLTRLAEREQLLHVVVEGTRIGDTVRELDPACASTQSARLELERLLLGLELGQHALVEVRDAEYLHPQLLLTLLPLAEGRPLELLVGGELRVFSLAKRRFVLVLCASPAGPGQAGLPPALMARLPILWGLGARGLDTRGLDTRGGQAVQVQRLAAHFLEVLATKDPELGLLNGLPFAQWQDVLHATDPVLQDRVRGLTWLARAWTHLLLKVGPASEAAWQADVLLDPTLEGFLLLAAGVTAETSLPLLRHAVLEWCAPMLPSARRSALLEALSGLLSSIPLEGSARVDLTQQGGEPVAQEALPPWRSPVEARLEQLAQRLDEALSLARAILPSPQQAHELFEARKQQAQQLDGLRLALGAIRRSLEELSKVSSTEAQTLRTHLTELLQQELGAPLKNFFEHQAMESMGLQATLEQHAVYLGHKLEALTGEALVKSVDQLSAQVEQNGKEVATQLDAHSKALSRGVESHSKLLSNQVDQAARGIASFLQQQGQGIKGQLERSGDRLHATLDTQLKTGFGGVSAALNEQVLPALRGLEQSALGLEQTAAGLPLAVQLGLQDGLGKGIERFATTLQELRPALETRVAPAEPAGRASSEGSSTRDLLSEEAFLERTNKLLIPSSLDSAPVVQAIGGLQRELHELREALQALLYRPLVAIAQQSDAIRRGLQESLGRSLSSRLDAFLERLGHLSGAVQHPSGHSVLDELAIISRELEGIRLAAQSAFPSEEESLPHPQGGHPPGTTGR